ncbi:MAG: PRC-barrel domain-containing protein [Chloroflexota bacterium]
MSTYIPVTIQKLIGKPIINIANGKLIAEVEDVRVNFKALQAAAVITSRGNFFNRAVEAISAEQVEVWGPDAVLVKPFTAIVNEHDLYGRYEWLSGLNDIRGYIVVAEGGVRVGNLDDITLDSQGRIRGYNLGKVSVTGRIAQSKWIAIENTHSLGPDVLVIKSEMIEPEMVLDRNRFENSPA